MALADLVQTNTSAGSRVRVTALFAVVLAIAGMVGLGRGAQVARSRHSNEWTSPNHSRFPDYDV